MLCQPCERGVWCIMKIITSKKYRGIVFMLWACQRLKSECWQIVFPTSFATNINTLYVCGWPLLYVITTILNRLRWETACVQQISPTSLMAPPHWFELVLLYCSCYQTIFDILNNHTMVIFMKYCTRDATWKACQWYNFIESWNMGIKIQPMRPITAHQNHLSLGL